MSEIITSHYKLEEYPSDDVLKREAMKCPLLAYCPDRTFSFCLEKCAVVNGDEFVYRKITFKHCYECRQGID